MARHDPFRPLESVLRSNMLLLAEAYREYRGLTLGGMSRQAHGDPNFFESLQTQQALDVREDRRGSFTLRKYDELATWFKAHWPPDLPVPPLQRIVILAPVKKKRR